MAEDQCHEWKGGGNIYFVLYLTYCLMGELAEFFFYFFLKIFLSCT